MIRIDGSHRLELLHEGWDYLLGWRMMPPAAHNSMTDRVHVFQRVDRLDRGSKGGRVARNTLVVVVDNCTALVIVHREPTLRVADPGDMDGTLALDVRMCREQSKLEAGRTGVDSQ
jgi:hypothetical protein